MRSIWVVAAAVIASTACQTGGDLGGGDPGWELDDAPFDGAENAETGDTDNGTGGTSLTVSDISATCVEEGSTDNVLEATVTNGAVSISHSGLVTGCDAGWDVAASIYPESGSIYVDYIDTNNTTPDQRGCWCAWTVLYTLSGAPAGDYTLLALNETATFTVE